MSDNKKKNSISFSKLIYNDKYLVVLSILLAIVVWITTSLSVGTDESKTIQVNVPIKLGDKVSEQLGMQYYSLQDTVDVSVTITGAKYVIGQVKAQDIKVGFDTSAINRTGNQTIPIVASNKSKRLDFKVESVYPSAIDGYFDVDTTKTFDIKLIYDKTNVASGYIFGDPVLSDDKVVVSGPKTYVDKIKNVYCDIDFGDQVDLKEPFNQECLIKFDGEGVETSYLNVTNREDLNTKIRDVSVTLPVLKSVILPVTSTFEDKPSGIDSRIVGVTYSTNQVSAGVLSTADISIANIGSIYFKDLDVGSQSFEFDTSAISGVTVLDGTKKIIAKVTVNNNYSRHVVKVSKDDVIIEGAQSGKNLKVDSIDNYNVTVIAPKSVVINPSDLTLKCDVSQRTEDGKYLINVSVSNPKAWVYGEYRATVFE